MSASAGISRLELEPGVTELALDTTGSKHKTASAWRAELGPVADLNYKRGSLVWKLAQSATPTTGAAKLDVKTGATVLATVSIDLTAAQEQTGKMDVPLTGLEGTSQIYAELTVDTAADGGTTASLFSALNVEVPLVGSC